jgi:hypothetical protein
LTAHEWESAQQALAHRFYLWQLGQKPQLAVVTVDQMQAHTPGNRGEELWESAKIPFSAFTGLFSYVHC